MFSYLLNFSLQQRWLVIAVVFALSAFGVFSFQHLPISAVPDISNVQVMVATNAPGYSPLETEELITFPVELAMLGAPRLEKIRSISKYGLSQVTTIFEDGTDVYFARQQINERIQAATANLPPGIVPRIGPISTGLGEIFLWSLKTTPDAHKPNGSSYNITDLRTLLDWVISPQLLTTPGLVEVNSMGGYQKEYHVTPDPKKLVAYGLSFQDVILALTNNNNNIGAGYIEHRGEQYLIRVPGRVHTLDEISHIQVELSQGIPILIKDIATVLLGKELRTGAATKDGKEAVIGIAMMLMGKNSHDVAHATRKKLLEIDYSLPKGVETEPFYDRTMLIDNAINTVSHNLLEGAALVIIILTLLLGNVRAALIAATVIPLSLLFTISGMTIGGISANLLSLGAIDFGVIVDGAVVIVENSVRHLAEEQHRLKRPLTLAERMESVYKSSEEARRALLFGQMIIMVVYIPIFALTGVEGKMFHPMAQTVIIALLGAMIFSITFVPAAIALFIGQWVSEKENFFMSIAKKAYVPVLKFSLENRSLMVVIALVTVILSGLLVTRVGTEFVPSLDEGDMLIANIRMPGTSLSQSIEMEKDLEKLLLSFPEVKTVAARIGTPAIATEVMGPERSDTYVMLKPREEWPNPKLLKQDLVDTIAKKVDALPGAAFHEYSQPIQDRMNMLLSGVKADVAIKVFGEDRSILLETADRIAAIVKTIPGASDVRVEQVTGLPILNIKMNQRNLARYGLNKADIQNLVQAATGGVIAGKIYLGDRRFNLVVRLPEQYRQDISDLSRLPIPLPINPVSSSEISQPFSGFSLSLGKTDFNIQDNDGVSYIPLSSVAEIDIHAGPNQISREDTKRLIVATFNVRGRDMGSVVAEAQEKIKAKMKIPAGYWVTWGGNFELMIAAAKRLTIVIPVALLLVFFLLYSTFGNFKDGLLVFTGIPFALTGGIVSLWLRGINLSISAGVGFIALSGVAVLNGLVMVAFINKLYKEDGLSLEDAVYHGALTRLRPVLMTALVASLGFIPMALAVSAGAEVQRPLATVVIGGILSSTILTLLLLPTFYAWAYSNRSSLKSIAINSSEPTNSHIDPNNHRDNGIEK
ncbi:efflux RND transporter permease subunit [Candidatus Nitrosacidococcus sp. I8]|uniref:efflux RND transporter permease subunit n=1 Tax=Candidatus Nitrosacidococcus sp. I8 TaxID=2942908 RepID=UPI0022270995|nr:CusA/CzcA family heavy metal efflux RND transporter [Candidatus Nitrosacidococcus sp. I8]CAH9017888.1 Cobalt-zinc-cadmium resistance protein CzcA [Candidatus Nitrosacidococcus sp. I8]